MMELRGRVVVEREEKSSMSMLEAQDAPRQALDARNARCSSHWQVRGSAVWDAMACGCRLLHCVQKKHLATSAYTM